jgi:hypothetical protein
VQVK